MRSVEPVLELARVKKVVNGVRDDICSQHAKQAAAVLLFLNGLGLIYNKKNSITSLICDTCAIYKHILKLFKFIFRYFYSVSASNNFPLSCLESYFFRKTGVVINYVQFIHQQLFFFSNILNIIYAVILAGFLAVLYFHFAC